METSAADGGSGAPAVRRDRDPAGRPRNARPRDGLGRPLPHGAAGIPTTPDDVVLPAADALIEAQRLLDAGHPFHAHEVLEGTWKAAPDDERELWRGLAQLAVGVTHAHRGNATGAMQLLSRSAQRIEEYADRDTYGVPVTVLARWARELVGRIEAEGLRALTAAELTPRLS
jgi:hypothetical protein